jgi:hypothetical protein
MNGTHSCGKCDERNAIDETQRDKKEITGKIPNV